MRLGDFGGQWHGAGVVFRDGDEIAGGDACVDVEGAESGVFGVPLVAPVSLEVEGGVVFDRVGGGVECGVALGLGEAVVGVTDEQCERGGRGENGVDDGFAAAIVVGG